MRSLRFAFVLAFLLVPLAFGWYQIQRSNSTGQKETSPIPAAQTGENQAADQAPSTPAGKVASSSSGSKERTAVARGQNAAVTVEVFIPPARLPISLLFRPILKRLDDLESEFPQTLRVIRYDMEDAHSFQIATKRKLKFCTILVGGKDVYVLQEGTKKRKVVFGVKKEFALQFTADDLEAVLRQALQTKGK